jgi:hypothetical protein
MAEPLKPEWQLTQGINNEHYLIHLVNYGDCTGVLLDKCEWDVEVRLWLADELVLHTFASDVAHGKRQVEAWLTANYPL